jgi:hypothetical protein
MLFAALLPNGMVVSVKSGRVTVVIVLIVIDGRKRCAMIVFAPRHISDSRMDGRTALRITFCFTQHFAGHGGYITLATENIVDQV